MSDLEIWITIIALVIATALTRSSLWLAGRHVTIPPRVQEMLRYAPACALAAIVAPDVAFTPAGALDISPFNPKLIAALASVLFYLVRRNMLHTIIFGMAVFSVLRITQVFGMAV